LNADEFWRLNFRTFNALKRRHHEKAQQEELRSAIVAASFINHSMSPPTKPVSYWRLMPSFWGREEEIELKEADQAVRSILGPLVRKES